MFRKIYDMFEAVMLAVIYLQLLFIGLAITSLGAFVIGCIAYRLGQFLWILLFKERWLGP